MTERETMASNSKTVVQISFFILFSIFPAISMASNAGDYFTQGCVESMSRQWESSIASFTKAIELNPGNPSAYIQRATALQMVDRINDAISDYETALKLRPDYYLALEYLANLYEITNQPTKALETYNRALPLVKDPKWRSIITWKIAEVKKKIDFKRARQ